MKYILTENKLKNFLLSKFNLDLENKVIMLTSVFDNRFAFETILSDEIMRRYLNFHGPMYIFFIGKSQYMVQPRGDNYMIINTDDRVFTEKEFYKKLGIPNIISLGDIIELYAQERMIFK